MAKHLSGGIITPWCLYTAMTWHPIIDMDMDAMDAEATMAVLAISRPFTMCHVTAPQWNLSKMKSLAGADQEGDFRLKRLAQL